MLRCGSIRSALWVILLPWVIQWIAILERQSLNQAVTQHWLRPSMTVGFHPRCTCFLHSHLFIAIEPVQLSPSSLWGIVGMSNAQSVSYLDIFSWKTAVVDPPIISIELWFLWQLRKAIQAEGWTDLRILFFLTRLVEIWCFNGKVEGAPLHNGCQRFVLWRLWQIEVSGCLWVAAAVGGRAPKD